MRTFQSNVCGGVAAHRVARRDVDAVSCPFPQTAHMRRAQFCMFGTSEGRAPALKFEIKNE